jgi:hypothetical protein
VGEDGRNTKKKRVDYVCQSPLALMDKLSTFASAIDRDIIENSRQDNFPQLRGECVRAALVLIP